MSTPKKTASSETAAVPAVNYTATAQERIDELRRWREQIPHFLIPATPDATQRLSTAASVPPEFIELTSIATANHRPLVRAEARTPDEVRGLAGYADAYAPLVDELEALAKFIRYSTTAARNTAGTRPSRPTPWLCACPNARRPPTSLPTSPTCAAPSTAAASRRRRPRRKGPPPERPKPQRRPERRRSRSSNQVSQVDPRGRVARRARVFWGGERRTRGAMLTLHLPS